MVRGGYSERAYTREVVEVALAAVERLCTFTPTAGRSAAFAAARRCLLENEAVDSACLAEAFESLAADTSAGDRPEH